MNDIFYRTCSYHYAERILSMQQTIIEETTVCQDGRAEYMARISDKGISDRSKRSIL